VNLARGVNFDLNGLQHFPISLTLVDRSESITLNFGVLHLLGQTLRRLRGHPSVGEDFEWIRAQVQIR